MSTTTDVLVIGAGLAGLVTAWQTTTRGKRSRVITKGWGATHWHSGCVDVLGYYPLSGEVAVESPAEGIARLVRESPGHPYAIGGLDGLDQALRAFQSFCAEAGYPMHGSLERNWLLPSAIGAMRPTCLAPETMVAGDLRRGEAMLIVGFEELPDFYPNLVAGNLSAQDIPARDISLDLSGLHQRRFVTTKILAQLFDQPDFRAGVVAALKPRLEHTTRVGFPAVLGLHRPLEVKHDLEEQIGCQVFEVPTLPPSVPGIRLHNLLLSAIKRHGGRIFDGMEVVAADAGDGRVTAVWTEAAARRLSHRAASFVLATGGIPGAASPPTTRGTCVRPFSVCRSAPRRIALGGFGVDFSIRPGTPSIRPDWRSTQPSSPWTKKGRSCTKICMPLAQPWLTAKPCANALWRVWRW